MTNRNKENVIRNATQDYPLYILRYIYTYPWSVPIERGEKE